MSQPPIQIDTGDSNAGSGDLMLTDLLPDYLNGHLSNAKREEVEAALEESPRLREQLEFQSRLQIALRANAEVADQAAITVAASRGSGFEAVADRMVDSPVTRIKNAIRGAWQGAGTPAWIPAFALLFVVGIVAQLNLGDSAPTIDDMEATDFQTAFGHDDFEQPTLLIIPRLSVNSEEFAALLSDYDLQLEGRLTESNIAEATPLMADADIESIAAALIKDDRVERATAVLEPPAE